MHNATFFSGTQIARLPKLSGKACAEPVGSLRMNRGQKIGVSHIHNFTQNTLWITSDFPRQLYTNCIQIYTAAVGNFTSITDDFYTLYTPLTTMTTTYINTFRRTT